MKKKIFLLITLVYCTLANAQFKTKDRIENYSDFDQMSFSWGYYLAVNRFDFKLHPNKNGLNENQQFLVNVEPKMGFSVGLMGRWRLNDYFDFRFEPGMHFVQRSLVFRNIMKIIDEEGEIDYTNKDTKLDVKSTYVDLPTYINFHGDRWYNTRPYVQAGLSMMVNLQGKEKSLQDSKDGTFRLKTYNFAYILEGGIEIYFKRFKLTPSVKGIFFFNNEWVPDNDGTPPVWAGALSSITTRAFMFSLKFE